MTKFDFKQWIINNKAQNKRALNENYNEGMEWGCCCEWSPGLDLTDDWICVGGWGCKCDGSGPRAKVAKTGGEMDEEYDMMDEQSNPNPMTICGTITGNICHSFSKCLGANIYGTSEVRANGGGATNPSDFYNAVNQPSLNSHFKDNTGQRWRYDGIDPSASISVVYPAVTSATNCCNCTCVYGCTDPNANNYNSNASCNDGSCTYGALEFTECQNCCCKEQGGAAFEEGVNPTINAVYQLMEQAARQRVGKIPTDLEPTPTNPFGRGKPTTKPDVKWAAPTMDPLHAPTGPAEPVGGCIDGTQYDPDVSTIIPETGMCKCPNPGTIGILSYPNPNPGTPNTTGASNGTGPC
jgi:hypothetical protein